MLIFSCSPSPNNSEFADRIKNADKIELFYRNEDTLLHYVDTTKRIISAFEKVLNGKIETRRCPTIGEIRFVFKDSFLFVAGFSISGGRDACEYLMSGENAWRLTYNTGMYLREILAVLKKDE